MLFEVLMGLSNVVVVVEEAVGRAHEAVVVVPLLLPLPLSPLTVRVAMAAMVVLEAEEALRLANPESRKLREPSWREKSKIARRWHH